MTTFLGETSALRGASSRRKRGSLHSGQAKSLSQEVLSPLREAKDEKKTQSLDNLDGNCEENTRLLFQSSFIVLVLS